MPKTYTITLETYLALLSVCVVRRSGGLGKENARHAYSCRNASIGSSFAARKAGYQPKMIPTAPEIPKAIRTETGVTIVFIAVSCETTNGVTTPRTTPIRPPPIARTIALLLRGGWQTDSSLCDSVADPAERH